MKPWRRLLFYLALNILVSAATTYGVLIWWDSTHRIVPLVPASAVALKATAPAGVPAPASTAIPAGAQVLQIKNVFGVGDLQNEVVLIKRLGEGDLSLSKWKLQDQNGHEYLFPDLVLNKDGAVQLYSRSGVDTAVELYWGQNEPIWKSGEQVSIIDPKGVARATYTIP
jgi:hypothetical protein